MPRKTVVATITLDVSCHPDITAKPETVEDFQWLQSLIDMIRIEMRKNPEGIKIWIEEIK